MEFKNLQAVLEEYGKDVRDNYKDLLEQDGHIASHKLVNSVNFIIDKQDTSISVSLKLEDYWKYLEEGTRPHWPPVNKILDWIKVKPVIPDRTYNGKLPTDKQLAYLIGRKISIEGTEGSHGLKRTLEEVNAYYEDRIAEAISKDIEEGMVVILRAFSD